MVLGSPRDARVDSLDARTAPFVISPGTGALLMKTARAHSVRSFLVSLQERLLSDGRSAPAWAVAFDETPPECSTRFEFEQVLTSAPTVFTQAMCFGMLVAMMEVASVTGLPYGAGPESSEAAVRVIRACQDRQSSYLRSSDGDGAWAEAFEEGDLSNCSRAELEDLLCTAPNTYFEGLLFGRYTLRESLAALTGRPFV